MTDLATIDTAERTAPQPGMTDGMPPAEKRGYLAGLRAGLRIATSLANQRAAAIKKANTSRGRVTLGGQQMAVVAKDLADCIWKRRELVDPQKGEDRGCPT